MKKRSSIRPASRKTAAGTSRQQRLAIFGCRRPKAGGPRVTVEGRPPAVKVRLRRDHGMVVGGLNEAVEEIRLHHRIVVQEEDVVEALLQAVTGARVVAAGGAKILLVAEEHSRREE